LYEIRDALLDRIDAFADGLDCHTKEI
jgi:hypothetical protein